MNGQQNTKTLIDDVNHLVDCIDQGVITPGQKSSIEKLQELNEKLTVLLKDGRLHTHVLQH